MLVSMAPFSSVNVEAYLNKSCNLCAHFPEADGLLTARNNRFRGWGRMFALVSERWRFTNLRRRKHTTCSGTMAFRPAANQDCN